jgi:multidrug efflux system membrane fusion protein
MKLFSRSSCPFFSLFLSASAAFIIFSLAFSISGCGKKKEEVVKKEVVRPVKIMTVSMTGAQEVTREFPGKVKADQQVDLAFQVSGPLITLPVKEGQHVKKGQILARIKPRDFETEIDKAKAKALEAEQQYLRYKDLYAKNQVSKADFDKYKSQYDISRAHQKEAEDALDDTFLRASFAGVVARKYVDNFQDVQAKEPIVSLQDISQVEVLVNVPENMISRIEKEKGKNTALAYATFVTAPEQQFPLSLKEYATEADPQTQTFLVTLLMDQPSTINVLPGMTATVVGSQSTEKSDQGHITVPAIAVYSDYDGDSSVWVFKTDTQTVHQRKVKTGELSGADSIKIVAGLEVGEQIAVTAVNSLQEGMKVKSLSDMEGYKK